MNALGVASLALVVLATSGDLDSLTTTAGVIPEPPVDAPDDADTVFERASTDSGAGVEVGFGLRHAGRGAIRRARSLRVATDGLDGQVRDGADDPLSGAEVGGRGSAGSWRVGRVAPQWGCGWLVGSPLAPWGATGRAALGGLRAGPRGDVATLALGDATRCEALLARFAGRDVAALRLERARVGVALAGSRRGLLGAGLIASGERLAGELAFDRRGRWRAEVAIRRPALAGHLDGRARGGSPGFRPLLAPTRGGPAQCLGVEWTRVEGRLTPRGSATLWSFGNGLAGALGRLEVDARLAHHAAWSLGLEEQRGTRRESPGRGLRQGWWSRWRGGAGPVALTLGLENWGRRSRARDPVRSATVAAVQLRTPLGGWLRAEQRAFRSGRDEGLRVADVEADRLVLRALSGAGERTRIELAVPGPSGRVRASWTLNATASGPARAQWNLDWTRRARIGGAPP